MIASIKVSECWLGTFSCVLTQCQEGETSAVILEHLLLHNSLEAVIRPFFKQFEFYSEKDYSQVSIQEISRSFTNGLVKL